MRGPPAPRGSFPCHAAREQRRKQSIPSVAWNPVSSPHAVILWGTQEIFLDILEEHLVLSLVPLLFLRGSGSLRKRTVGLL